MRSAFVLAFVLVGTVAYAQETKAPAPESPPAVAGVAPVVPELSAEAREAAVTVRLEREHGKTRTARGFLLRGGGVVLNFSSLEGVTGGTIATAGAKGTCTGVRGYDYTANAAVLSVEWEGKAPAGLELRDSDPEAARAAVFFNMTGDATPQAVPITKGVWDPFSWQLGVLSSAAPDAARLRGGCPVLDAEGRVLGMITAINASVRVIGEGSKLPTVRSTAVRSELIRAMAAQEIIRWDQWPERERKAVEAWTTAHLAQERGRAHDFEETLSLGKKAIETDPRCWGGWMWVAVAHYHTGRADEALEEIGTLLKLQPVNDWGLSVRAVLLASDERDFEAAEEAARLAVKRTPRYSMAHYALGFVLQYEGDYDGAKAAYKKALELEPGNENARLELRRLEEVGEEEDGERPRF